MNNLITSFDMARLKTCLFLHLLEIFFQGSAAQDSSGFSLELIPWDSAKSPLHQPNLTQTQKIHIMAMSSKARAVSLASSNTSLYTNAIQIPVKNQALLYSVNIKIGHQATEVTLLLDTGSGPIWTQCRQSGSYFNPLKSRTYKALPCGHPLCLKDICRCKKGLCYCYLEYGIKGGKINKVDTLLSSDKFNLPIKNNRSRTFNNMIFGCSTHSPVFSGILGMDRLPVSLISQVRKSVQGRFSYCLHSRGGYLSFGSDIPQIGKYARTTPILHPQHPIMFLDLKDISVGKKRLSLRPSLFSYRQGGFIMDTGAKLTVINKWAYDKVIRAFANYYDSKLKRVNGKLYALDLCYERNSSFTSYASMTFHLQGADYVTNNLYVVPETGMMCIGLIPGEISILGVMQQWNTRFVFDINKNKLQFVSEDCSKARG